MAIPTAALLLALAAAAATMLGWLIAVAKPRWKPRTSGWFLLAAAVAMVSVSLFELLPSASAAGRAPMAILVLVLAGAGVVVALHALSRVFEFGGSDLQRSALVIALALAIHNFPEGSAPYAAALVSLQGGLLVALSLGLHNVAEGLAVATPVLASGGSRRRAFAYTTFATVGEMAGAVTAFLFTAGISDEVAGGMIALVAGVMIAVSALELLPAAVALIRAPDPIELEPAAER